MFVSRALTLVRLNSKLGSPPRRRFSFTLPLFDHLDVARVWKEHIVGSENLFSRKVLLAEPNKYKSMAPLWRNSWPEELVSPSDSTPFHPPSSWEALPNKDLLVAFRRISESVFKTDKRLSDVENTEMCRVLSERVQAMSDDEIRFMLETVAFWNLESSIHVTNFVTLWKSLDSACCERYRNWPVDKIFLFADYWYNLHLARQSDFVYRSITRIARKPNKLLPHQLVQLLFFLNVQRTLNESIDMYEIEFLFKKHINSLSLEEIGVAVTGFFKTQNVLHDQDLMANIMDRVIQEKDTVQEITLCCILKVLRLRLPFALVPKLTEMIDAIEPHLGEKFSLQTISHVVLLLSKFPLLHEKVLKKSAHVLLDNLRTARIKDMEKILFTHFLLSNDPKTRENMFEAVGRELLNRQHSDELEKYPMSLIALLNYLSFHQVFVEPLISQVLDEAYFRRVYGKTNYAIRRELFSLDSNVELNCPSYSGLRLSSQLRKYLSTRFFMYPPELDKPPKRHNVFFHEVLKMIDSYLGRDKYAVKHILPHSSRPDVIIRLDDSGSPTTIPNEIRLEPDLEGKPIRWSSSDKCLALVIASRNMFAFDGVRLLGETTYKMRQLQRLGFESKLVSFYDFPHNDDDSKKLQYLKGLISSNSGTPS